MPTGWPPPTTCSESPDSARPPHEAPLHHPAARAAAGDNHPALRLIRPLSPPWQSNWLIKPFPQKPASATTPARPPGMSPRALRSSTRQPADSADRGIADEGGDLALR